MNIGSALGAFIVGNSRSGLRTCEGLIVRGSGSLKVYHWRQVERYGGTRTEDFMWGSIHFALAAASGQVCIAARKNNARVWKSRALPEFLVV